MELKKKQNTWKMLMDIDTFRGIVVLIAVILMVIGSAILSYIVGYVESIFKFPGFIFNDVSVEDIDAARWVAGIMTLFIGTCIGGFTYALFLLINEIYNDIILTKANAYLPIDADELKKLNFATYRELEDYIVNNIFSGGVRFKGCSSETARSIKENICKTLYVFFLMNHSNDLNTKDVFLDELMQIYDTFHSKSEAMCEFFEERSRILLCKILKYNTADDDDINDTFEQVFGRKSENAA